MWSQPSRTTTIVYPFRETTFFSIFIAGFIASAFYSSAFDSSFGLSFTSCATLSVFGASFSPVCASPAFASVDAATSFASAATSASFFSAAGGYYAGYSEALAFAGATYSSILASSILTGASS